MGRAWSLFQISLNGGGAGNELEIATNVWLIPAVPFPKHPPNSYLQGIQSHQSTRPARSSLEAEEKHDKTKKLVRYQHLITITASIMMA